MTVRLCSNVPEQVVHQLQPLRKKALTGAWFSIDFHCFPDIAIYHFYLFLRMGYPEIIEYESFLRINPLCLGFPILRSTHKDSLTVPKKRAMNSAQVNIWADHLGPQKLESSRIFNH